MEERTMSIPAGERDYRIGGLERLHEAGLLLKDESFAGGVYLSGRAVEGMLRAVIWKSDDAIRTGQKSLETGHSLRDMLELVGNLGVLAAAQNRDRLTADVQQVARLWFNNMRFVATDTLKTFWWRLGEIGGKRT